MSGVVNKICIFNIPSVPSIIYYLIVLYTVDYTHSGVIRSATQGIAHSKISIRIFDKMSVVTNFSIFRIFGNLLYTTLYYECSILLNPSLQKGDSGYTLVVNLVLSSSRATVSKPALICISSIVRDISPCSYALAEE